MRPCRRASQRLVSAVSEPLNMPEATTHARMTTSSVIRFADKIDGPLQWSFYPYPYRGIGIMVKRERKVNRLLRIRHGAPIIQTPAGQAQGREEKSRCRMTNPRSAGWPDELP